MLSRFGHFSQVLHVLSRREVPIGGIIDAPDLDPFPELLESASLGDGRMERHFPEVVDFNDDWFGRSVEGPTAAS